MAKARQNVIASIFRKVEAVLRADERLKNVITSWKTFKDNDRTSPTPPAKGHTTLVLFPLILNQFRESEASDEVTLAIQCQLTFDSNNACEWTDIWFAIQEALWPPDMTTQLALHAELRTYGATTGQPSFDAPTPMGDVPEMAAAGKFDLLGQILIGVRKSLIN